MNNSFIYETAPFPSCHASTLIETTEGKILAAWFGGSDEGENDVAIWMSRLDGKWTAPVQVAAEPGRPCWNPVFYRAADRPEITLYYKAGPSPQTWSGFYKRSTDHGATWGEAYIMPAGLLGPIKNKAIDLADGTIVSPSSVESYKTWASWVERSSDRGRTWTKHGPIAHPQEPNGVIQPTILTRRDGSLLMLMRATRQIGQVCQSESRDAGLTWSAAQPIESLPNPNSGIDAVTLQDGRQLLVHNPTHEGRTPLAVSISSDDGATWKVVHTLEDQPGEFSYPAVIQAKAGTIHISYTWHRKRIRHWTFEPAELKV